MVNLEIRERDGMEFLSSPLLGECGFVRHAFSTRQGGVSEAPFGSLNLGEAEGERREIPSRLIHEAAHEDANIIFGSVIDSSMTDTIRVIVIATGFGQGSAIREVAPLAAESTGTDGRKLSVPAYVRARGNKKDSALSYQLDEDDLDVPTFLRKQAD